MADIWKKSGTLEAFQRARFIAEKVVELRRIELLTS
jgi:hypothetical protein